MTSLYDADKGSLPVGYEIVTKTETIIDANCKKKRKSKISKNECCRNLINTSCHNNLNFKYVLTDNWFSSSENMKNVKISCNRDFIMSIKRQGAHMNRYTIILLISIISIPNKSAQSENNTLEQEFKSTSDEAMQHYCSIRMIFEFLQEAFKAELKKTPLLDQSHEYLQILPCPNPAQHKTKRGLLLDIYYDKPIRLWTPWGGVNLTNEIPVNPNPSWRNITNAIFSFIVAEIFNLGEDRTSSNIVTYKITTVFRNKLPEPETDTTKLSVGPLRNTIQLTRKMWDDLKKEYESSSSC